MTTLNNEELLQFLLNGITKCSPGEDNWVDISELGSVLKQQDAAFALQDYGVPNVTSLLERYQATFETRVDTKWYHARVRQSSGAYPPAPIVAPTAFRPSKIPLLAWAYFPSIPKAVNTLKGRVVPEKWSFNGDISPGHPHPILWNYLIYTFLRLQRESKLKEAEYVAAFNTGLVDKRYKEIYAFFRTNQNPNHQKWQWEDFCIAAEDRNGKDIVSAFKPLPEPAQYFSRCEDRFYDVTLGEPTVDWEHVIIENIGRLPLPFLREHAPQNFNFKDPFRMSSKERKSFLLELGKAVREDSRTYRRMISRINEALELAIRRVRWNYKTAIPQYYPRKNAMTFLLPLALMSDEVVDLALVVEKTPSGNYLGHTIFPLHWAYMNARLVCRPDSDWLAPDKITQEFEEEPEPNDQS